MRWNFKVHSIKISKTYKGTQNPPEFSKNSTGADTRANDLAECTRHHADNKNGNKNEDTGIIAPDLARSNTHPAVSWKFLDDLSNSNIPNFLKIILVIGLFSNHQSAVVTVCPTMLKNVVAADEHPSTRTPNFAAPLM